jgi:hypothetical protein
MPRIRTQILAPSDTELIFLEIFVDEKMVADLDSDGNLTIFSPFEVSITDFLEAIKPFHRRIAKDFKKRWQPEESV